MKNKFYKKLVFGLCLTVVTSGCMVPYNVLRTPTIVMAAETELAGTVMIDISTVAPMNGIRTVVISESGKYILTGNNFTKLDPENGTGGVYEDVQIIVNEDVTADLYLDGLEIHNDDAEYNPYASGGSIYSGYTSPLVINGTANIHILDDSTITAIENLVTVNGTMNIVESKEKDSKRQVLKLISDGSKFSNDFANITGGNGKGTIHIQDSDVIIDTPEVDQSGISGTKITIDSGSLIWKAWNKYLNATIVIDGGYVDFEGYYSSNIINSNNIIVYPKTFSGLTAGVKIDQINETPQTGVYADSDGKLKTYLPNEDNCAIYAGGKAYRYDLINEVPISQVETYKVQYLDADTGKNIATFYSADGEPPILPVSDMYDYTFNFLASGLPFPADTPITDDVNVSVSKSLKVFDVLIDGEPNEYTYGDTVDGLYYEVKDGNCTVLYPGDSITRAMNLTSITDLELEGRDLLIKNADDLYAFADLVNNGCNIINGKLTADIDAASDYPSIGSYTNDDTYIAYKGTFDGQGHTVKLQISRPGTNYNGFINVVGSGAVIKNVITTGEVKGYYATGGIVGGSRGSGDVVITNCINKADVIGNCTVDGTEGKGGTDAAGIIGTNGGSDANFTIMNCANLGDIVGYEYTSAICSWAGYGAHIENCYNTGSITCTKSNSYDYGVYSFFRGENYTIGNCYAAISEHQQSLPNLTYVPLTDFTSGAVAWKMNGNKASGEDENAIWYQDLSDVNEDSDDSSYPTLFPEEAENSTVYEVDAYKCDGSPKGIGYSNVNEDLHEQHQYEYSVRGNEITASCKKCLAEGSATVRIAGLEDNGEVAYGVTDWLSITVAKSDNYPGSGECTSCEWYVKPGTCNTDAFREDDMTSEKILSKSNQCETNVDAKPGVYTYLCKIVCDGVNVNVVKTVKVIPQTLCFVAKDQKVHVGQKAPGLTYELRNLKEGDTEDMVLTQKPTISCNDLDVNKPGAYTITISGAKFNTSMVSENSISVDTQENETQLGYTISENSLYIPGVFTVEDHVKGAPVKENEIPATTEIDGSYDEVISCSICGVELSRTKKIIPKLEAITDPGTADPGTTDPEINNPASKGSQLSDSNSKAVYTVTSDNKNNPTVEYKGPNKAGKKQKTVKIPDTITIDGVTYKVTGIAKNAFKGNKSINKVTISKNIKTIGVNAFSECTKLKTVTIGNNVVTISKGAFYKCKSLTKIIIPSKVNKIGEKAFYGCSKLVNISVKTTKLTKKNIGSKAFSGVSSKVKVKVPNKKLKSYTSIFISKGLSKKATFTKL